MMLLLAGLGVTGAFDPFLVDHSGDASPAVILGEHRYPIHCLAFAPDGKRLASGGGFPGKEGEVSLFRVYRRQVLERIPFEANSDDFLFDTQLLVQAVRCGFRLGDIPVPVRYFPEASSISFARSLRYSMGTLGVVGQYWLDRLCIRRSRLFRPAPA